MTEPSPRDQRTVHEQLSPHAGEAEDHDRATTPRPSVDSVAEAAYWRKKYEAARRRLGKLWVAYKDLEAELELRRDELETMADQRAVSMLQEHAGHELLAIAAPDRFGVVSDKSEATVVPGQGTSFPLVLSNRSEAPLVLGLAIGEVTEGWKVLLTVEDVELEPKSSRTLHVILRSHDGVDPGDVGRATVLVRHPEQGEKTLTLEAVVEAPEPPQDAMGDQEGTAGEQEDGSEQDARPPAAATFEDDEAPEDPEAAGS